MKEQTIFPSIKDKLPKQTCDCEFMYEGQVIKGFFHHPSLEFRSGYKVYPYENVSLYRALNP